MSAALVHRFMLTQNIQELVEGTAGLVAVAEDVFFVPLSLLHLKHAHLVVSLYECLQGNHHRKKKSHHGLI